LTTSTTADLDYQQLGEGQVRIVVKGSLNAKNVGSVWAKIVVKVAKYKPAKIEIDANQMDHCDAAGIALLQELKSRQEAQNHQFQILGLRNDLTELMALFDPGQAPRPIRSKNFIVRSIESIGQTTANLLNDLHDIISFIGEIFVKLFGLIFHPGRLRWGDTILIAEKAGADGVGITALLGFLIGLILAFQAAIAMNKFGVGIYVADLVTISLLRELGPLITAFVIASRSGSAFAAELGTMKVNEEIDALTTMGIDPVRFLVFPRLIAAVFVLPLLTMFSNAMGLLGCALVMISMKFTPSMVIEQIHQAANLTDLLGGLAKTLIFGTLIASIGCLRGLQTKTGASAVGDSATRAVVSSIVAIVVVDGIFAVVFYFLGI